MKKVVHKAETRGHANHGWLDTHHTFSFARYYNPERVHFGALRVLNDDYVIGGEGFDTHPHDNMEIISIPLEGVLEHRDSMGNLSVISAGEIQVMSAGTGIHHSEYNKNPTEPVKFLQIWVFPNKENVKPRYDQISLKDIAKKDELYQIVSPNPDDQGVWVHQNTWFYLGDLSKGWKGSYQLKEKDHGAYILVLEGSIKIAGEELNRRDGIGIYQTDKIDIEALSKAEILLMEVPML